MHKIPRVYRYSYGFTGKMTPGDVYPSFCPELGSVSDTSTLRVLRKCHVDESCNSGKFLLEMQRLAFRFYLRVFAFSA